MNKNSYIKNRICTGLLIVAVGFFSLVSCPSTSYANALEKEATKNAQKEIRETRRIIRKTMRSAVKKVERAKRGESTFNSICASCHSSTAINKLSSLSRDDIKNAIKNRKITDHSELLSQQNKNVTDENMLDISMFISITSNPA